MFSMDSLKQNQKRLSCVLALLFLCTCINAQNIDSIGKVIEKIMHSKGERVGKGKINSSSYRLDTIKINHFLETALDFQASNYDSLLYYSTKALKNAMELKDPDKISRSVQLLGRYYMLKEDYKTAGECFLLCLNIEDKSNNQGRAADINDELGRVYHYQEIFSKSLQYYQKALDVYEKAHDTGNIAKVYSHLGSLHSSREFCETRSREQKKGDFSRAIDYFEKSVELCIKTGNKPLMINSYVNLASVYNKLDQPLKALPYLNQALDYYRAADNKNKISGTLYTLGKTYFKLKQYSASIQCYKESQKISTINHYLDGIQYLYEAMAQSYYSAEDYKNAYDYYIKYMTIRDSLISAEKSKALFELETRYQTEKKEKEILTLTTEKRERNMLLLILFGLILFLLILGFFIIKYFRSKKTIAEQTVSIREQHIRELEKERQLIATKSVLQGEEAERGRMARDLHDGLGGMLSSVKINLSTMKGNSIITDENAEAFNHAISLLDHSITELRRVAHNMMPETLVHYGLKAAFEDFVSRIRTENVPGIDFQFFGVEGRYSSELEITVYRIGQELVNNSLKHSEAGTINLQLISETNRVCLQVIDNGKGFDSTKASGGGKGLESIRDRIAAMDGKFEIWSNPGEGTEATVEFLVP